MSRLLLLILCLCLATLPTFAHAEAGNSAMQQIGLAVIDFDYTDSSGEVRDQTREHQERLQGFMAALRKDLLTDGKYRLVTMSCGRDPCSSRTAPAALHDAAKAAGADILLVGGIHKMSTLVQWAKVQAIDIRSDRVLFDKLYTFRGDTDEAWQRAQSFVAGELRAMPASQRTDAATPIKLALFDFELEDFSAANSLANNATDPQRLQAATDAARRLIAQSGRYNLVDLGAADGEALKGHWLHKCNGCDAKIAQQLGADQSLVGVVTRISRTEYTVSFELRDALSGAVLAKASTDLRIGADYSWDRGAAWLIKNRLLALEAHQ